MSTETGSDEEEDEDEDQMYVSGIGGAGKKKFLVCVSQASSVPWDWNGIPGEDAWCEDYGAYNLAYYLISKSPFRDAKYLVEESRLPPIWLVSSLSIISD